MGTDGACSLLFCAAKRSGAFPPNMPADVQIYTNILQKAPHLDKEIRLI
jgi:hypothetical protein